MKLPAVLAFSVLAVELIVPWTAKYYVTQDGPSHIYTAVVATKLLSARWSVYDDLYRFAPVVTTNWSTTVLLSGITALVGVTQAEKIMADICLLTGFFGLAYLIKGLDLTVPPWSPLINFLLNTFFLWIGFYNFHLGMGVCAWALGYYLRHRTRMSSRNAVVLAVLLLSVFFTHVHPYGLAVMAIVITEVWVRVMQRDRGPVLPLAAAIAPSLIAFAMFLQGSQPARVSSPEIMHALVSFPMHAFANGRSRIAQEIVLRWAVLIYVFIAIGSMRKAEWRSTRGAFVIAAVASFVLCLVVPDSALGGGDIKIRFAWAVFVFGGVVAISVSRWPVITDSVSLIVAVLVAANVVNAGRTNVARVSAAVEEAMPALQQIPRDSVFLRAGYPDFGTRKHFGFDDIIVEPLFHIDSLAAARQRAADLTDYQALNKIFPIFEEEKLERWRAPLWALERPYSAGARDTAMLVTTLPARVDYVLVIGDDTNGDRLALLAWLRANMQFVASDPQSSFVWLFKRK